MPDVATGTTLTHGDLTGEILSVTGPTATRESIRTSHMGTTGQHTFIPADLSDSGEVTVEVIYDSGDTFTFGAAGNLVIDMAGDGNTMTISAFSTEWEPSFRLEEMMVARYTFKLTAGIAFA